MVDSKLQPRAALLWAGWQLELCRNTGVGRARRAGRAVGAGVCRLWTESRRSVGIGTGDQEADLALALELAVWGMSISRLRWLDPPPTAAFAQARELLTWLGALDAGGAVTEHGRRMAELGLHPRLAHMVLRGAEAGHGVVACDLAALLESRDILRREDGPAEADLRLRLEVLAEARHGGPPRMASHAVHEVGAGARAEAAHWRKALGCGSRPATSGGDARAGVPDRLGRKHPARAVLLRTAGAPDSGRSRTSGSSPQLNDIGREGRSSAPLRAAGSRRCSATDQAEESAWDPKAGRSGAAP